MKFFFGITSFWLYLAVALSNEIKNDFMSKNLVYQSKGNVSVIGIFGSQNSSHCTIELGRDLEEIASAIWTIEALNNYQYLHGITIGLSIINSCTENMSIQNVVTELIERDSRRGIKNIGILTKPAIFEKLRSLSLAYNVIQIKHIIETDMLVNITVQLLSNLQWMVVDAIVTDFEIVAESFCDQASNEGISVRNKLLIHQSYSTQKLDILKKDSLLVVVIATFYNISVILETVAKYTQNLVIVPTDYTFSDTSGLVKRTIVLLPPMEDKNILKEYIKSTKHHKDFFNHREPTKSPLFLGVATSILKLLKPYKTLKDEHCEDINQNSKRPCAKTVDFKKNKTVSLPQKSMEISPDDIVHALYVLKIHPSPNDEMFLYLTLLLNGNDSEDLAIFQMFGLKARKRQSVLLKINDNLLKDEEVKNTQTENTELNGKTFRYGFEKIEEFHQQKGDYLIELLQSFPVRSIRNHKKGSEGQENQLKNDTLVENNSTEPCKVNGDGIKKPCQNFEKNVTELIRENDIPENRSIVVWRFLTWVSINTSIGFMGVMCILSIMFFIISRVCKGDVLEGSPCFTFLLMVAVIVVFAASLPFHFVLTEDNHLLCTIRITGPPLAYSILFSLLLSRSLMLASSEGEGIISHINGYLQTVLFCFIIGIQLSLTSQHWISKDIIYGPHCSEVHEAFNVLIAISYNLILLTLLICISPFIVRSKRNYKEGLLFSIAVFFMIVVWSIWISFYFLLPKELKDAAIAMGLNATACTILICIFIPRTYLMVGAMVRDRTNRGLPSFDRNILSEIYDANYKSSQTLNESVLGTVSYKDNDTGVLNPNFCSRKVNENCRENSNTSSVSELPSNSN